MSTKNVAAMLGAILLLGAPALAIGQEYFGAAALPLASKRLPASAEECAVWGRERSFAASVVSHDKDAWISHLHPGVIFDVTSGADAMRGLDAVTKAWPGLSGTKNFVVRWRPGVVMIGGDPNTAVSVGPYVFQGRKGGVEKVSVGFFQTIWVRDSKDGVWRVLFDGDASTEIPVADRAAADAWVAEQDMSDCLGQK